MSSCRILFVFHKNNNDCTKAKVKPPRLNGKKVGLFSTRCPYRPNNIGLTLAKLESVRGKAIVFSFLAHLSRRLIGELIVYEGICRPSVRRPSSVNIFKIHLL